MEKRTNEGWKRKKDYINDYNKKYRKNLTLSFNMKELTDIEMYEHIVKNGKTSYIKKLIINDMKKALE